MGKFDALAKALGLALEKYGDDAAKILEKVDSPELATSLRGAEKKQYRKALDEIYGPVGKRADDLGFVRQKVYHGGPLNQSELIPSHSGHELGSGVYLTDKETAKGFGKKPYELVQRGETASFPPYGMDYQDKIENELKKMGWSQEKIDSFYESGFGAPNSLYGDDANKIANFKEYQKAAQKSGFTGLNSEFGDSWQQTAINPADLRSTKAAFDPRFKDSPLLMAGALAAPMGKQVVDMNPLGDIREGLDYYDKVKTAIAEKMAGQLNIGQNKNDESYITEGLKFGADPVNYIPGGAEIGLLQMAQPFMPKKEDAFGQALNKARSAR